MTKFDQIAAASASRPSRLSLRKAAIALWLAAALALGWQPLAAQDLQTFDPDDAFADAPAAPARDSGAIDADLIAPTAPRSDVAPVVRADPAFDDEFAGYAGPVPIPNPAPDAGSADPGAAPQWVDPASGASVGASDAARASGEAIAANEETYAEDDLIGAAQGVFGKGAEGLAKLIEDLLKKEGRPNGYIVGREAGGAFIVGARYGSGTLHHKVEGERKVYWTGPSVGFDAGANAANTFVLVYNLYDSEDLFKRYPAGEGQAYFVGGLHASYMRRGDVVLIPIRMGAGLRLGVNAGYMKFSKKQRWLPF